MRLGPALLGHAKIALDITAVEFDQFSLYSTNTMIIYDRLSL